MTSALFIRPDSFYKQIPDVDCWDEQRNALLWPGGNPAIFHPPCRQWGRMRAFAKIDVDEKALAVWAVGQIRTWGGVLEHPAYSSLWKACNLPLAGIDEFGGFTLSVNLHWFGFPAEKKTFLYVVGCRLSDVPAHPLCFDAVTKTISSSSARYKTGKTEISKCLRDRTPYSMALWLHSLCQVIETKQKITL